MHEAALMESIIETITTEARRQGIKQVGSIRLVVGRACMVSPAALLRAFTALRGGGMYKDTVLQIEERPVNARCPDCGAVFVPGKGLYQDCPCCGGGQIVMAGGREFYIDSFEGE